MQAFDGSLTGCSEYQDGISKLGNVILRYDLHEKQYLDSIHAKPCQHCVRVRPTNWLASKLNRFEYKALAESQTKEMETLEKFQEEMAKMGQPLHYLHETHYCPYFESEYQVAYGPWPYGKWGKVKPQLY